MSNYPPTFGEVTAPAPTKSKREINPFIASYSLPIATDAVLGGVLIDGGGLSIDVNGLLSLSGGGGSPGGAMVTNTIGDGYVLDLPFVISAASSVSLFEWDAINGNLVVNGNITATGEISAFSGSAPIDWWDSIPHAAPGVWGAVLPDNDVSHFLSGLGTWVSVTSGTFDHNALSNKAYADSGHTGFSPTIHNLIDTTNHPVSGLTTGHFLKATGATTYGFGAHGLTYTDVNSIGITGTPSDNQIAVWTGANTQEGTAYITFTPGSPGVFHIDGDITATGEISAFSGSAPTNWWDSMPVATTTVLGGVKIDGTTITIAGGVISSTAGGGMTWPSGGAGIPYYSGSSSWGTSFGIANNTDNYIVSMTGTGFNGEANLTFNGSTLNVTGDIISSARIVGGGLSTLDSEAAFQAKVDTALDYQYYMRFKDEAGTIGFYITNGAAAGSFFPVFTGKVTSSLPALYFVGNCVNGPASGGAIVGFDARKNNGAAAAGEVAIGFFSGFGSYLAKIYGNGDLTATGVVTASGGSSTNWNTAYSHTSSTSNPHSVTASQVGLGNVTNESKATMFTNAAFTGTTTGITYTMVGACSSSDARLSDARNANDVYTWAKQATKPSYTYSEVGADAAGTASSTMSSHTSTYNHTQFQTAYSHSQNNSQAHSDYLINNGDDSTSGVLTAAGFNTANFKIVQSGTNLLIQYGSTTILTISSAGYVTAKDEVKAFG